jgi:hypothetical protein
MHSQGEQTPGYPYNMDTFSAAVLPVLTTSCAGAACHSAPAQNGGFTVWSDAGCSAARTFNSVIEQVDLATPANSPLLAAVNGSPGHPFAFPAGAAGLAALNDFVATAAASYAAGGGGTTAPPGPSPFDYAVFQSQLQPALDAAGCATAGCHGTGAGGFAMKSAPAAASADMEAAFIAVTSRTSLVNPARSLIYTRSTVQHAGASTQLAPAAAQALLAWITTARANAGTTRNPTCAPVTAFNAGVFKSEIMPILSGQVDFNRADHAGHGAGCMASVCHGVDRGPGKLSLPPPASDGAQLQSFACFVNLAAPQQSELVVCPSDYAGCRTSPHPGQDVLGGGQDLNYRRVLAFIYSGKSAASPFDYAYFIRKVNPTFNVVDPRQGGDISHTCADYGCHGVTLPGEPASNGSDFPILSEAFGDARLTANFVAATGFVNFLDPADSSLYLYPTNEIANRAAHPLASGNPHPGGHAWSTSSEAAQAVLTWAAGLRPDAQGYQRNWLVAGDFIANRLSDPTPVDETTVTPRIFDPGGGSFNVGQWDGLFSSDSTVDLDVPFSRPSNAVGRLAYATSYVVNTYPRPQTVQLIVTTSNPVRVYVNGQLWAQNDQSGGTTASFTLAASGADRSARILIKVMQRSTDRAFAFRAQLTDDHATVLTDSNSGLVFMLGPDGGV